MEPLGPALLALIKAQLRQHSRLSLLVPAPTQNLRGFCGLEFAWLAAAAAAAVQVLLRAEMGGLADRLLLELLCFLLVVGLEAFSLLLAAQAAHLHLELAPPGLP
jgi:hypothetical protein